MTRTSKRALRPGFDDLEGRQLLSTVLAGNETSPSAPVITPLPAPHPPQHEVVLHGLLSGSYSAQTFLPDAGTSYDLSGQGQVQPLGSTNVRGNLHSLGFIPQGYASGTLTLSDSKGTLTLKLSGPPQRGFSPLPDQFDYEITGGTGAFVNATGRGLAILKLSPATTPNPLWQQGRFDLRLEGSSSDYDI